MLRCDNIAQMYCNVTFYYFPLISSSTPGCQDPWSLAALHSQPRVHHWVQGLGIEPPGLHRVVPGSITRLWPSDTQGSEPGTLWLDFWHFSQSEASKLENRWALFHILWWIIVGLELTSYNYVSTCHNHFLHFPQIHPDVKFVPVSRRKIIYSSFFHL